VPFFSYRARNPQGELVNGVLESADSGALADLLFASGVTPLEIALTSAPRLDSGSNWWRRLTREKIRSIDVQLFSRQLYTLLKSGVPIMRGLAGLQESAINKSFALVLGDIRESLDAGRDLSATMRRHPTVFSPFYLSMVRVGEMTGRLEEIFLRLFDHLEFERMMRERVRTAMRYPMFVVIAMAVAITVINLFVIPAFAKVYAGFNAELPLMTRGLIGFSNFMVQFWPLMLAILVGSIVAFRMWIATPDGRYRWDKLKLRFPIVGKIVLKGSLARFARSLALATKSGVPIVQGLVVVAQTVDNAYLASRITLITPVVLQMIAVGEETGELDSLMDEIAQMYEREVDYELKTLSSQIEPILIVGLGILVLVLALGVFLPIWDLGKVALHK
jgi:MSHA biogenesis protein MshG